MITLFGIPNCDTVKKTQKWLEANQVNYTFHNYKTEGISAETLKDWCTQVNWELILNKKSTTWRGLTDDEKSAITGAAPAITLMQVHTSLIKRPVVAKNGRVSVIGYDETALKALLA